MTRLKYPEVLNMKYWMRNIQRRPCLCTWNISVIWMRKRNHIQKSRKTKIYTNLYSLGNNLKDFKRMFHVYRSCASFASSFMAKKSSSYFQHVIFIIFNLSHQWHFKAKWAQSIIIIIIVIVSFYLFNILPYCYGANCTVLQGWSSLWPMADLCKLLKVIQMAWMLLYLIYFLVTVFYSLF